MTWTMQTKLFTLLSPSTILSLLLLIASSDSFALKILYAGPPASYPEYSKHLRDALLEANLDATVTDHLEAAASADYIVYSPNGPIKSLEQFSPKAVFNLRAGAEGTESVPRNIPVTRMVDPGLQEGMVEYVVGHTLRYHLSTDRLWKQKERGEWAPSMPPLARRRTVGILGLGELGSSCADALLRLNFQVYGWSRTPKEKRGVDCYYGPSGLDAVVKESDILVLLLPDTPQTKHIINTETLAKCKPGVCIINVGRGSAIDEDDLLKALKDGTVGGATLDVFQVEPLPEGHGFWNHPNVLITPHIAAKTRASTASRVIVHNIQRTEKGEPLLFEIDRDAGY